MTDDKNAPKQGQINIELDEKVAEGTYSNLDIINQVDKGTLMVDYFGHGGEDGWSGEGVFRLPEIQSLKNQHKLPLFITVTCEFSRFDNPLRKTAGEFLFWKEDYGASTLISTTREIYISVGQALNEQLVRPLLSFNGEDLSIAEALTNIIWAPFLLFISKWMICFPITIVKITKTQF